MDNLSHQQQEKRDHYLPLSIIKKFCYTQKAPFRTYLVTPEYLNDIKHQGYIDVDINDVNNDKSQNYLFATDKISRKHYYTLQLNNNISKKVDDLDDYNYSDIDNRIGIAYKDNRFTIEFACELFLSLYFRTRMYPEEVYSNIERFKVVVKDKYIAPLFIKNLAIKLEPHFDIFTIPLVQAAMLHGNPVTFWDCRNIDNKMPLLIESLENKSFDEFIEDIINKCSFAMLPIRSKEILLLKNKNKDIGVVNLQNIEDFLHVLLYHSYINYNHCDDRGIFEDQMIAKNFVEFYRKIIQIVSTKQKKFML